MPPNEIVSTDSFTTTPLVVVAGKGGVGKTTVTAALAVAVANAGLRVVVVTLDGRPGMSELLGGMPDEGSTYEGDTIVDGRGPRGTGWVHLRSITASEALQDYLATQGLARLAKRLVSTGVVDVVASAAPGIDDLLVLGKVKHLVGLAGPDGPHDLVIVDGPAAGHALSLLRSPSGMAATIRSGPLHSQSNEILSMLHDPARTRVVLVTLPETTPINELTETASTVTDELGIALGPVVVNGVDRAPDVTRLVESGLAPLDDLGDAARYRAGRCAVHARELVRLHELGFDRVVELPHLATSGLTARDIEHLAANISGDGAR